MRSVCKIENFGYIIKHLPKMDKIANFSWCMKELLISKRKLFGQLCYITSRTTEETSFFINELMQGIVDIFKKCKIPIGISEDGQKDKRSFSRIWIVVQCYNYLLLNTSFPSQDYLQMDFANGHKVNMWPNISPYLFIQIIWRLEYEEVLVESLQYIPLDLCAEILDITIKCLVELKSERAISLIFSLINRIYCKCLWLDLNAHLKNNAKERLYQLVAYFQMLLDLFDKFNQFPEICIQEKYKQRGTFLKRILRYTRLCMCKKLSSNLINPDVTHVADMYRLTSGTMSFCNLSLEIYHKFTNYEINSIIIMLDQELITLLLKHIQEIDYLEYVYWTGVEDEENIATSLQHAVVIECHNFMKYMKKDDFLVENNHLRHLLQQFIYWSDFSSPENSNRFSLSLQELRASIVNDKSKNMRKLMKRYKEWDKLTMNFISDRVHLLQEDIFFLLEYLHHVFANSLNATERNQAYVSVITILHRVEDQNLFLNVLKYTKRHFQDNYLECMYDDKMFHNFIKDKIDIHDPLKLRVLMICILLNAKKVLTILIKIVIEYIDYKNFTFTAYDLLSLQQFLCIKADERYNLLLVILKEVCFNNNDWNVQKFCDFVVIMIQNKVIKTNDLFNYFYIPYLLMTDIKGNLYHIAISLQFILMELDYANKINYILLTVALAKKMSLIRRNTEWIKEQTNEILSAICEILIKFPAYLQTHTFAVMAKKLHEYKCTIGNWLEPLDRAQMLMVIAPDTINVLHVIQDYEARCFPIHQRLRTNSIWIYNKRFTNCTRINRESLIRHMMLHATMSEFKSHVYELTELYYHFGWTSQLEAYENLVRIAAEAIQLTIVYSKTFPPNASITLLRTLVKFCKKFAKKSDANLHVAICYILLETLSSLKQLINGTQYAESYSCMLIYINNMFTNKFYTDVKHYFCNVKEWMRVCFGRLSSQRTISVEENLESSTLLNDETNSRAGPNKLFDMFNEYNFVCDCMTLLNTET
ncbi:uncharacterized protein [Linepithema humile]|uniref:uncharacterized protein isoform X3 n=1 Tax=Linepithema humile TaxID=83485 RepID=UPI0006236893|nr:PREDICTED: uncharacterized protein LOC105667886 isoform X2 [Linepithema humile]